MLSGIWHPQINLNNRGHKYTPPRTACTMGDRRVIKEEREKIRQVGEEEIGDVENITWKIGFMQN